MRDHNLVAVATTANNDSEVQHLSPRMPIMQRLSSVPSALLATPAQHAHSTSSRSGDMGVIWNTYGSVCSMHPGHAFISPEKRKAARWNTLSQTEISDLSAMLSTRSAKKVEMLASKQRSSGGAVHVPCSTDNALSEPITHSVPSPCLRAPTETTTAAAAAAVAAEISQLGIDQDLGVGGASMKPGTGTTAVAAAAAAAAEISQLDFDKDLGGWGVEPAPRSQRSAVHAHRSVRNAAAVLSPHGIDEDLQGVDAFTAFTTRSSQHSMTSSLHVQLHTDQDCTKQHCTPCQDVDQEVGGSRLEIDERFMHCFRDEGASAVCSAELGSQHAADLCHACFSSTVHVDEMQSKETGPFSRVRNSNSKISSHAITTCSCMHEEHVDDACNGGNGVATYAACVHCTGCSSEHVFFPLPPIPDAKGRQ